MPTTPRRPWEKSSPPTRVESSRCYRWRPATCSVNLAKFVVAGDRGPAIDYAALKDAIAWSVRFLDNTIDMSRYPLDEIDRLDWVAR